MLINCLNALPHPYIILVGDKIGLVVESFAQTIEFCSVFHCITRMQKLILFFD